MPGVVVFQTIGLKRQIEDLERKLKDQELVSQKHVQRITATLNERVHDLEQDVQAYEKRLGRLQEAYDDLYDEHGQLLETDYRAEVISDENRLKDKLIEAEERWIAYLQLVKMFLYMVSHGGLESTNGVEAAVIQRARRWLEAPPRPIWVNHQLIDVSPHDFLSTLFNLDESGKAGPVKKDPARLSAALARVAKMRLPVKKLDDESEHPSVKRYGVKRYERGINGVEDDDVPF